MARSAFLLLRAGTAGLFRTSVGFTKAPGAAGLLDWDTQSETWIGDFRPYDLRHTCALLMIRAHVPPADVAAQLGTSLEFLFRTMRTASRQ